LLRVLNAHGVDFIVVGGVCAVLHGAPMATFDLDLVHSRSPENIERLLAAMESLNATSRAHPGRIVRPGRSHLTSPGHQLLMTQHGPLDLLETVGSGRGYEELLPHAEELELAPDLKITLLKLETLIQLKEQTSSDKDLAVLPLLRRTLEEEMR
jgi:predicted nucleotidyltransferase